MALESGACEGLGCGFFASRIVKQCFFLENVVTSPSPKGYMVVMVAGYLSGERCWCPLKSSLLGFMPINTMGSSIMNHGGVMTGMGAVQVFSGKACMGPPQRKPLETAIAPAMWLKLIVPTLHCS